LLRMISPSFHNSFCARIPIAEVVLQLESQPPIS
jgi:hypothetical protein